MGNVTVFAKAFQECGIGGRFSKFQLVSKGEWIELHHIDRLGDPFFCYRVHNRIDTKGFRSMTGGEALELYRDSSDWVSLFKTAQKTIARIVGRKLSAPDNRYYFDHVNQSVVITNQMFVIEVTPALRNAMDVETNAVMRFLDESAYTKPNHDTEVSAHTRCGEVVIHCNGLVYPTYLPVETFNNTYGEL